MGATRAQEVVGRGMREPRSEVGDGGAGEALGLRVESGRDSWNRRLSLGSLLEVGASLKGLTWG